MVTAADFYAIRSKHKAINTLFPYAVWLEQNGEPEMIDTFFRAAGASKSPSFMWDGIKSFVATMFDEASPDSLNSVIILASSHVPWGRWYPNKKTLAFLAVMASPYTEEWHGLCSNKETVVRWAAAASAVPYTEEAGQSIVSTLLHIASTDSLKPHIPVGMWAWLNKRPLLPPVCRGREVGTTEEVVRQVRALEDIEILKSYLLLVWSEWYPIDGGESEMSASIREEFSGIGMWSHREDLIKRLDHVLEELDRGLEYLQLYNPSHNEGRIQRAKEQYGRLKWELLEVDGDAMNTLARTPSS